MLKVRAVVVTVAAVIFSAVSWVVPAQGTPSPITAREAVCPTWKLRGATGQYPTIEFGGPPAESKVIHPGKVRLTKPADGVMPGVEFAAYKLDIDLPAPKTISVGYRLSTEASAAAGAVRLFYYHEQNADTINDAPAGFAAATGDAGTLTVAASGKVGTVGLVYDASNPARGFVEFTGLRIGSIAVKFADSDKCVKPSPSPSLSASAPASPSPSASPSLLPSGSPSPSASLSTSPAAGGVGGDGTDGGTLPLTGAPATTLLVLGVVLLGIGAAGLVAARRRQKTTFTT